MRFLFTLIYILIFSSLFCQTSSYSTITISKWMLEKFPKHYLIKAAKVYTEKDKLIGKITFYQELNEYGQSEGLTVRMQNDYSSPHTVYYYRNGVVVYLALFFNSSTKAYEIVNKNIDDVKDGPQVKREFLADGKLQEIIDVYKNGVFVSTNKPDDSPKVNWVNGLLDGKFKFRDDYSNLDYAGEAKNGEIIYLKETYLRTDIIETKIIGDTIYRRGVGGREKGKMEKFRVNSRIKISIDESIKDESGYLYCEYATDIPKAISRMQEFTLSMPPEGLDFDSDLLDGHFLITKGVPGGYTAIGGVAQKGYLSALTIEYFSFDPNTGSKRIVRNELYDIKSDSVFITKSYEDFENASDGWSERSDTLKKVFKVRKDSFKVASRYIITRSENLLRKNGYYSYKFISSEMIDKMRSPL